MLAPALQAAADALLASVLETEEYLEYRSLKETVLADAAARIMLQEYQKAQVVLQMTALAGREAEAEAVDRFTRLSDWVNQNDETARYLFAQLRLRNILGEVFRQFEKASGLGPDYPGV